ncbi:homogentisate 1,2-dioxygenase [Paraburkholderia agricolaris]|uniref:homogentisate 1,2-dioxygenase n=1 Tax=Paraburkholderia agricolaris TaxID=2152888 RepID=UPI0038BB4B86
MSRAPQIPLRAGNFSRQAHADLPDGTYEREVGREGFGGQATHFYHRHPPTAWTHWEGAHRPRAFDLNQLGPGQCPLEAPLVASNAHLQLRVWKPVEPMPYLVRNADGDELFFVHAGGGDLYCDYGHITLGEGDYFVLPRGTMWRLEPHGPSFILLLEATGAAYRLPDRGLLGEHALFDPAVLDVPQIDGSFLAQQSVQPTSVRVKARQRLSTITFGFNPLDAVGWKGTLVPIRLNWRDIRPVSSDRYHLPPSAHSTFVTDRFAVCTFCPRPAETDPGALKVPFFHSNDDYDELLFLHAGQFFSRSGMGPGAMTFHPSGFPHGPHPGPYKTSRSNPRTRIEEVAINIDARDPLDLAKGLTGCELAGHVESWLEFTKDIES